LEYERLFLTFKAGAESIVRTRSGIILVVDHSSRIVGYRLFECRADAETCTAEPVTEVKKSAVG
jgi:hypothetical protein